MADRYGATVNQAAVEASPGESMGTLHSLGTTHRGEIFYMAFSAGGTMADQLQTVQVQRITALGTEGAAVVPTAFDSAAPAAILDAGENHSAEPTYTAATELWQNDVHVRALAQIQLQPDGHIILPAVLNAGIGVRSFSANYVGGANATLHYLE